MNEEDEDETDGGRTSENLGMKAPIIGYEVIDQRQKFTVRRPVRFVVFNTKTKASSRILFFHFVICVVRRLTYSDKTKVRQIDLRKSRVIYIY